jgi:L-cysteine:1D-myo-inositol 2-amino-2-deoxy-alpha-D-glucopyranoside ligase
MQLYDTARRGIYPLEAGPLVTMYSCGITPYDSAHLGHAYVYLTFDILQRRLRDMGHETRCVRNVTDVDDDLLRKARELGVNYLDLAAQEMAKFERDMAHLNLLACYSEPRATGAIPEILTLIGRTFDAGLAYQVDGYVYFEVAKFPRFGQVSHESHASMLALAATHGGQPDDPRKRDPLDFVLWQPSLEDEPAWESRWGAGRPGWHIECSALALRELGETVDVHGGGRDLAFPHHECEAAQSEAVPVTASSSTGSTSAWWDWMAPRCPSPSATSSSWASSWRPPSPRRCDWPCSISTTAKTGSGATSYSAAPCRASRRGARR